MKRKIIIISSIVVGLGLVGGFVVYPIVKRNLIRKRLEVALKDPAARDAIGGLDKLQVDGIFSSSAPTSKATISRLEARDRAKQVWNNYSAWLSSDETAIVSAFNGLGHRQDVTKISNEFLGLYTEDLLSVLKNALRDKTQYNLLLGIISKLPTN